MEITIKTKYNPDDKVYGFYNGRIWLFKIDDIQIDYNTSNFSNTIAYRCTAVVPEDCEVTFSHLFEESELHTKEQLILMVEDLPL